MAFYTLGGTFLCVISVLFSLYPNLPSSVAKAVEVPFVPKNILIYGGNGFIGTSTAERLIAAGHKLTLVNRGNWYWDSAFTVRPFVQHIKCDRMQLLEKCSELFNYISSVDEIDAVIDFSGYHPLSVRDTVNILEGKAKFYIYISTDSVYEVCLKNHTEPSRETDAVRPTSQEQIEEFEAKESYGHRKLQCEELLADFRKDNKGPPFISLRLPDVIGPRDNTYRWWIYQMWMQLRPYLDKDVTILSSFESQPMSLVFVNDVADLITRLVNKPPPSKDLDQAYNLALRETPSLRQMLVDMRDEMNLTDVKILSDSKPDTIRLFPSVHLGPVNISKAEKVLNWNPTDWNTVVKETIKYYESAIKVYFLDDPRRHMTRTMQTYFTSKPYNVIRGFKEVYGMHYPEPKEEL